MKLQKIRDNLYVPEDFAKSHWYYADAEGKKKYTGVTTIINVLAKPQLIGWAARMATEKVAEKWAAGKQYDPSEISAILEEAKVAHTKKKEDAGSFGTGKHSLVEAYIGECLSLYEGRTGSPDNLITEKYAPIKKFLDWAQENVDHFLFAERRMASTDLFVAGTADFAYIGKDGKKYMADFKTSSGVYGIDFWLQTAAYRMLAEDEGDESYDGCVVVRMGKDGSFEVLRMFDYETCKNAFLSCLTLYRAQANLKNIAVKDPTTMS